MGAIRRPFIRLKAKQGYTAGIPVTPQHLKEFGSLKLRIITVNKNQVRLNRRRKIYPFGFVFSGYHIIVGRLKLSPQKR